MDDVIQLLVFLATFIIFIVSVIIKQKKKSGTKGNKLESVIESFFGVTAENKSPTPSNWDVHVEAQADLFEAPTKDNNSMVNKKQIKTPLIEEGIDAIHDYGGDLNIDNQIDDNVVETGFDLRKAVIYSEILNRKTF